MTAVATRPRAVKVKPAPVTSPVAAILARIGTAHDAIRAALSATDESSDLWVMLFGIDDNLMPYSLAPLYRTPASKEDVGEAYDALLFTLTVLKAALMMSKGLVMETKLQEAFEILDRAHSDMDSAPVQFWPIPDHPPTQEATAGEATNFERGIAVAIDLLRAEEASRGKDDVTCYRRHREGRPQFRFWREHIEKLIADPALLEGFDAVMSASREDGQCVGVSELKRVAPNEYSAGEIGADGTVPDDAIDAAWKAEEAATTNRRNAQELLYDYLDQAKTLAFLVSFQFSGDGVDDAPGTTLMIEGTEAALSQAVEFMGSMARQPNARAMDGIRHAHALAAHLLALSRQDLAANAPAGLKLPIDIGFNLGNSQVRLCYWTLEKMINRAEEALSGYSNGPGVTT